jgi:hypothetical protein
MELDDDELTEWQTNKKELLVTKPDDSRWLYTAFAVDRIKNNRDNWKNLLISFLRLPNIRRQSEILLET